MIRQLFEKWFGLEPSACLVCEVLREQLANSERERRELLQRALAPPSPEPVIKEDESYKPITPQFIPWRLRQQMLEAEDHKKHQLMQEKAKEIDDLEKELGVSTGTGTSNAS
jgi:hypothetical protein